MYGWLLTGSGSHLAAVHMVQQKQVEAAAVDANTLAYNKLLLQDRGRDISVLTSLGPLPPYPIVVNSRLSGSLVICIFSKLTNIYFTHSIKLLFFNWLTKNNYKIARENMIQQGIMRCSRVMLKYV